MLFDSDFDWQEALRFRPGQKVELKRQPGVFDTVASYDPMMVPPISLVNDPMPRYPEELRPVHRWIPTINRLNRQQRSQTRYSARIHNPATATKSATRR